MSNVKETAKAEAKKTVKKSTKETECNSRYREYLLTINNPVDKGFTHDRIKEIIETLGQRKYWCMCDEKGLIEETYHTHLYINLINATSFQSIKKKFGSAHIDVVHGQPAQVRDYIMKSGKWEGHVKQETKIPGTQEEWGICPAKKQGARTDLKFLYEQVAADVPTIKIIEANPNYLTRMNDIDRLRQLILSERYKSVFRHLDVTYIWGSSGAGKTRSIMEQYGYNNVFRVTNYDSHPFDEYTGQDVIIFEEFRSSLKIQDMLNYLDGYPLRLPCRYTNKEACYTKVYITTNIPFEEQYESTQTIHPETWKAFQRRIHHFQQYVQVSDTEVEIIKTEAKDYYREAEEELPFQ